MTLDVPGISAAVIEGAVLLNQASGLKDGVAPVAVDWAKADLTDERPGRLQRRRRLHPGLAAGRSGRDAEPAGADADHGRGKKLAVAGRLISLDIFGVLSGEADFALQTSVVDVDFDGSGTTTGDRLDDASLMTFGLSNLSLSVGLGGVGLSISGGSLGIATLTPAAPASGSDERSWSAVTGKDLAVTLNIPGINGTVSSGSVRINRGRACSTRPRRTRSRATRSRRWR